MFKIIFINQGQVYEIYAKGVGQSSIYGFVEISDLVFGEKSKLLVDPAEERLASEFEGVKRFYVPMHAVVRIDEVEKEGVAKISDVSEKGGNVSPFPSPYSGPGDTSK